MACLYFILQSIESDISSNLSKNHDTPDNKIPDLAADISPNTFDVNDISNNKIPDLAADITTIYIYLSDNILTNIDMK